MSRMDFRKSLSLPKRTCTKTFRRYQSFKEHLREDFKARCGYTDSADKWFGGVTSFHIDHFACANHNPSLKTQYSNLVYSCSYVNILKSDDDHLLYLDPCVDDYNKHFFRDNLGTIHPISSSAKAVYMYKKLKMGLARYQIAWILDHIFDEMGRLESHIATLPTGSTEEREAKDLYYEFGKEFRKYIEYLTK